MEVEFRLIEDLELLFVDGVTKFAREGTFTFVIHHEFLTIDDDVARDTG